MSAYTTRSPGRKRRLPPHVRELTDEIQLDMFGPPIGAATVAMLTPPNRTPLVGIPVRLPNQCGCGAVSASIVPGRGPHLAGLRCDFCSKHRGWVSREAHQFIAETVERFGPPPQPIEIRTSNRKETDL